MSEGIKNIQQHLDQQRSSGMSRMAYCRDQGISYHQFNYHYRRQDGLKGTEEFVQIKTSVSKPSRGVIELHFGNGTFFRFDSGIPDIVVKRLLRLC
ncbi:MAG TPA: hypothetical protein VN451_04955 [Chitinophagaceae bacterium]|nr:hypothetical protein [Chitinophagaceae bacterium]